MLFAAAFGLPPPPLLALPPAPPLLALLPAPPLLALAAPPLLAVAAPPLLALPAPPAEAAEVADVPEYDDADFEVTVPIFLLELF